MQKYLNNCSLILHTSTADPTAKHVDCLVFDSLHLYGSLKKWLYSYSKYVSKYILITNINEYQYIGESIMKKMNIRELMANTGYSVYEATTGLQFAVDEFLDSEDGKDWKCLKDSEILVLTKNILPTINCEMNNISLQISFGEVFDKLSILELKKEHIKDPIKLQYINAEYELIHEKINDKKNQITREYQYLCIFNRLIWNLTDKILAIKNTESNEDLSSLREEIFQHNQTRYRLKKQIETILNSSIKECKSNDSTNATFYFPTDVNIVESFMGIFNWYTTQFDKVYIIATEQILTKFPELVKYILQPGTKSDIADIFDFTDVKNITEIDVPEYVYDNICFWTNTGTELIQDPSEGDYLTYVSGGHVGDLIHVLYVIAANFIETGKKGILYLTENEKYKSEPFYMGIEQTFQDTLNLISSQVYIQDYEILTDETLLPNTFINLNKWRDAPFDRELLKVFQVTYCLPLLTNPWLKVNTNDIYKDYIVVHRSMHRQSDLFPYKQIVEHNKCLFICGDMEEYITFPYKSKLPVKLCKTIEEMAIIINSCKFFVGNQSCPLAIAYALKKPALGFLSTELLFYGQTSWNKDFYWIAINGEMSSNIQKLPVNVRLPNSHEQFYGQFGEDKYIKTLFPQDYKGTCVDVGAYNGITSSNTYHFEQNGWNCLCIEPIPEQYEKCKKIRKLVFNCCAGNVDNKEQTFHIFNLPDGNQSAISSLKPDEQLISDHKHLIEFTSKINVTVRTITSILDEAKFPTEIDFMSIDTENTELDVLKGLDFNKYKINIFIIENNYNKSHCEDYLKQYGYKKFHHIEVNDFFIKNVNENPYTKYHGQFGEDKVLKSIFPGEYIGTCAEIGAYNGIESSATYHFEKNGWDCICVEPIPREYEKCKKIRTQVFNCCAGCEEGTKTFYIFHSPYDTWGGMSSLVPDERLVKDNAKHIAYRSEIEVTVRTVTSIFDEAKFPINIDFMTIDTENTEIDVLKSLDLTKYNVKVLVVENNYDDKFCEDHLKPYGYTRICRTGVNDFFVRKDLFPNRDCAETIIFVQKQTHCSVYQYGQRLAKILKIQCCFVESKEEILSCIGKYMPTTVVFNWHSYTMPWCNQDVFDSIKVKKIVLNHSDITFFNDVVNVLINQTEDDIHKRFYVLPRPIIEYPDKVNYSLSEIPKIGSFGFVIPTFRDICKYVNNQFDQAILTLNIPFAYFGDQDGKHAKAEAIECHKQITKPGIKLIIDHEFKTDDQLVDFLSQQTINIIIPNGDGVWPHVDYTISSGRPLAISNSQSLKHIYDSDIDVEIKNIKTIIDCGTKYVDEIKEKNSNKKLIEKFKMLCSL